MSNIKSQCRLFVLCFFLTLFLGCTIPNEELITLNALASPVVMSPPTPIAPPEPKADEFPCCAGSTPVAPPIVNPTITIIGPTPLVTEPSILVITVPSITALKSQNVRNGPGLQYDFIGYIRENEVAVIIGKSSDGAWWKIACHRWPGTECWLTSDLKFSTASFTENIPIITPFIPTPIAPPAPPAQIVTSTPIAPPITTPPPPVEVYP